MNIADINPNLPCLRILTCSPTRKRRISCSTSSKSTRSSSSAHSKTVNSMPVLIQLCMYPNEEYAYETMKTLFSSRHHYSPNVCDEFGCSLLMYTLRYQRFRLFDFLLNELPSDLNIRSKDQQGNTILHYAIIYAKDNPQILDKLIEEFSKFAIAVDERNVFGFTPLLLGIFCGRYDLVLTLLMKTDASPFVRDYIQSKNLLDYLEFDIKHQGLISQSQHTGRSSDPSREFIRLRIQLHQTFPPRSQTSHRTTHHYLYKNFFENVLPHAVQDRSGLIRSSILKILDTEYLAADLTRLTRYINRRFPKIKTLRKQNNSHSRAATATTTKFVYQRENSKISVHQIFNLFDPNLRSKAILPKPSAALASQLIAGNPKTSISFKRLGTKLTLLAALSRPLPINKRSGSLIASDAK